jgi:acyl carrier protein
VDATVQAAVVEFVVQNFLFGDVARTPRAEESLTQAGVIDSTGVLELIEFLEVTFGIEVAETETVPENLDSIANLRRYVTAKRAELPAAV